MRHHPTARVARLTALGIAAWLTACSSVESDIRRAFVERYEKENCLSVATGYPFQVRSGPGLFAADTGWLDALVQGGILQVVGAPRVRGHLGVPITTVTLDLTDAARQRLKDNKLCYGRTTVKKVVDYQGPNKGSGGETLEAEVLLEHQVDGDWVLHPALEGRVKAGEETISRTLVKKTKAGWSLP